MPGRLVVKFRDTLGEPADVIRRHGLRFAASARSGGADLDRLVAEYRVSAITPVFSSLFAGAIDVPGKGALADRRRRFLETVKASRAEFAARAARAPRAELPDLVHVYVLEVPADTDIQKMAHAFAANPSVESATPDYVASVEVVPNDPYLGSVGSWGQAYGDLWPLATIGAPAAWDVATGLGAVVAVVDSGLDYNHPDIVENVWANAAELNGVPGVDDDGNGYVDDVRGWDFAYGDADPMDRFGHGTHVAGTIAAVGNNNLGVIGVAYQARIMPVKGLGDTGYGGFSNLAAAITYAARNGADVINNSWGCSGCSTDVAIADSIALARSLGSVVTFAAGNSNADVRTAFPANVQDVITVASSGADDSRSSFSNWGYLVDVAAPGGGPDGASLYEGQRNILSLRAANTGDASLAVGGNYLRQAGTSMAAPHVSGVAALLLSANPQLTVAQVESLIRHTARDEVGSPSLDAPGYDPYYGWGRLDASAAVARAFDPPADPPILEVVGGPLEFDVPATMCAGQQWALPVDLYNIGGDVLAWSASGPDWLSIQPGSGTMPSFPLVSVDGVTTGTGTLTLTSNAANGPAQLSVVQRVSSGVKISNCNTVLSKANADQRWDPLHSPRPPAVPDGSGGAFYVWVDTRNGNPDLFMQHVDGFGNVSWTADGVPLTSAAGAELNPTIVSDGAGGAIIAWMEGSNSSAQDKHIRAQRVNGSGQKLWGVDGVWVSSQANPGQTNPTVLANGVGGAFVAWQEYRSGASDIYAQKIDANGAMLWQAGGLPVTQATGEQFNVAIVRAPSGGMLATWVDRRSGSYAIYAQRLNAFGQPGWVQDGLLVAPEIALGPNIVSDGAGGAIIAWHDFRNLPLNPGGVTYLSRSDIYAVRLNALGESVWPAGAVPVVSGLTVAPSTFVPGYAPDQVTMTSDGRGGAFVVWHDWRNASWDVYTQRVDPLGSMLWGTNGVPVTAAYGDQISPLVVADGEDGAFYAWSDKRPGHYDVFVQRLGPTGVPLAASNGVWVEGKPGNQLYPYVVPLAKGRFLVTWDDWSNCASGYCGGTSVDLLGKVVDFGGTPGFSLTVASGGDGAGTVTSSPAGIVCGASCSAEFPAGWSVTLTAQAASGSIFFGWTGACVGAASTCTVTMDAARTVGATFSLASYPLTVATAGSGRGTVTGDGISCTTGSTAGCTVSVPNASPSPAVTLTATPATGYVFSSWSGCTSVAGNVCTVSMTGAKSVTATFLPPPRVLTVKTAGTGRGTVTGEGISCTTGSTEGCTASVPNTTPATSVTLTAAPEAGWTLYSWSGCTTMSGNVCTVSMDAAKTVTATFQPATVTLTARTSGIGRGTVTGEGISCTTGSTAGCTVSVPNTSPATSVTLTATPEAESIFASWSGCTSVAGNVCTVSMTSAKSVTATFQPSQYALTVKPISLSGTTATGTIGGAVACSDPAGCTTLVANGATVTLTAAPDASSLFKSWTGCTSVDGATCTVTMTSAKTVTATFMPSTYALTVKTAGVGAAGTVQGDGIDCSSTTGCAYVEPNGATITLTAVPDAASLFKSWTGCTSTIGVTCTVSMSSAKTVTATFQPSTYALTVKTAGAGAAGAVQGDGVDCSSTTGCTYVEANGATLTLTAVPDATSLFKSWTGCTSTNGAICTVSMSSAKTVTATFMPSTYALTVNATASGGSGTVTGPGISCTAGSTAGCTTSIAYDTTVTLTATPDASSILKSWTGCTSVSGNTCTVTITAAKTVTANFQPSMFVLTVNPMASGGTGTVTGPGIACTTGSTAGCTASIANGETVTLTATADAGSILKSWTGCTSVSGATCTVTMTATKTATATFQPSTYPLTVKPASYYGGTGTITGAGPDCTDPAGCTTAVANGSTVTLTANPATGSMLKSWSGCTTTSGSTCTVTISSAKTVTATFQPTTFRLTVTTAGAGTGTVTGPGIACTSGSIEGCAADESAGSAVTLTATPGACATFTSWSGGCYGTASPCTVTMSAAKSVTATFAAASCPLSAAAR
ncbi:InlB B-repeat-containing protein [Anaeromyxobacter terrae]|uniref:InlB B-repeat-containing protein n=1 Tax=Anaeromyxobacter terrae TaxID=2925406 RepID=UPI001F574C36|nr:S8 family serine peptidase [Anaeromyxobacter sp. SG22]